MLEPITLIVHIRLIVEKMGMSFKIGKLIRKRNMYFFSQCNSSENANNVYKKI